MPKRSLSPEKSSSLSLASIFYFCAWTSGTSSISFLCISNFLQKLSSVGVSDENEQIPLFLPTSLMFCLLWVLAFPIFLSNAQQERNREINLHLQSSQQLYGEQKIFWPRLSKFFSVFFLQIQTVSGFAQPSHFIYRWSDQGEKNHPQACVSSSPQLSWLWRSFDNLLTATSFSSTNDMTCKM